MFFVYWPQILTLVSVILIDATLAVDNAIVIASVVSRLSSVARTRAMLVGIGVALFCRVLFACFALQLLQIVGLTFAGGLLLLWVAWKLWRDLRSGNVRATPPEKTFASAVSQIVIADISMSLDNSLAVAGTARNHFWIMVVGLALSVAFMGLAANQLAKVVSRHKWVAYLGLAIVCYVAISMIYEGVLAIQRA